jgi:hypothetical protein
LGNGVQEEGKGKGRVESKVKGKREWKEGIGKGEVEEGSGRQHSRQKGVVEGFHVF